MKRSFDIIDYETKDSVKAYLSGEYLNIEFVGDKVSANKRVYIYSDLPSLIKYFEHIRLINPAESKLI